MDFTSIWTYAWLVPTVVFGLILLFGSFFTVDQQHVGIVERFGKFVRLAQAGLNFKIPLIEKDSYMSLQIMQLSVEVETKTKDNVFVKIVMGVQYFVLPNRVKEACYLLNNSAKQIESFVYDVVRARVPKLTLDEVFERKDEISDAVKNELAETMDDYGYGIAKAPVTDIDPDKKVKESMNEINAAQRLRSAALEKGEAEKVMMVKKAEAEAESKRLQGEGIANQRKAIIHGLRESVETFREGIPGATPQDVMNLVLLTQYFDTMKDIGASSGSRAIFIPSSPDALSSLADQMRNALLQADEAEPKVLVLEDKGKGK